MTGSKNSSVSRRCRTLDASGQQEKGDQWQRFERRQTLDVSGQQEKGDQWQYGNVIFRSGNAILLLTSNV
jgi:hypothetical protein